VVVVVVVAVAVAVVVVAVSAVAVEGFVVAGEAWEAWEAWEVVSSVERPKVRLLKILETMATEGFFEDPFEDLEREGERGIGGHRGRASSALVLCWSRRNRTKTRK
jgi:hypothetical protein